MPEGLDLGLRRFKLNMLYCMLDELVTNFSICKHLKVTLLRIVRLRFVLHNSQVLDTLELSLKSEHPAAISMGFLLQVVSNLFENSCLSHY